MKKLEHWESNTKAEIRKLHIVCGDCQEKVSVGGFEQDGKLIIENCPACGEPIGAYLYSGIDDGTEPGQGGFPITAEVTWAIQGGIGESERSSKFGPMLPVSSLLMNVIDSGAQFFANSKLPPQIIFASIAIILASQVLNLEQIENLLGICTQRLTAEQAVEPFEVVENPETNGAAKTSDEKDEENDDNDE